jgi:peroxiredoxin
MLGPGDRVPDVQVWTTPREDARSLKDVLGGGLSLLCFYVYDWSPG